MPPRVRITVVVNDEARDTRLRAEHGWSAWLECGGRQVLLDTGQGPALAPNAAALGLPWERLEAVALSHGHYDHTGGLAVALSKATRLAVYAHPAAWHQKYACPAGEPARNIGTAPSLAAQARALAGNWVETTKPVEVIPGLWLTGPIPRRTAYEDMGGAFYQDALGRQPDDLVDDQAVFFDTPQGLAAIVGCAHAGVINTLEHIRSLRPGRPLRAVIGGMHMLRAGADRLRETIAALDRLGIERLHPAHCTGATAQEAFERHFGPRCTPALAGDTLEFR